MQLQLQPTYKSNQTNTKSSTSDNNDNNAINEILKITANKVSPEVEKAIIQK